MAADTARVFIALWPDTAVRTLLSEWRDAYVWPKSASPVRTEQLHATLHFLGNIPRERLPELAQELEVPFSSFELEFGRPEIWHGGIAVLELDVVPEPLLALHGALGEALESVGLMPEERVYRPHVTLARRAGPMLAQIDGPPVRWQIDGYALMESTVGAGSSYEIVQQYTAARSGVC